MAGFIIYCFQFGATIIGDFAFSNLMQYFQKIASHFEKTCFQANILQQASVTRESWVKYRRVGEGDGEAGTKF